MQSLQFPVFRSIAASALKISAFKSISVSGRANFPLDTFTRFRSGSENEVFDNESFKKALGEGRKDFTGVQFKPGSYASSTPTHLNLINVSDVNLTRANLSKVHFSFTEFKNVNLSGANLTKATFSYGSKFEDVNLSGANLTETDLPSESLDTVTVDPATIFKKTKLYGEPDTLDQQNRILSFYRKLTPEQKEGIIWVDECSNERSKFCPVLQI